MTSRSRPLVGGSGWTLPGAAGVIAVAAIVGPMAWNGVTSASAAALRPVACTKLRTDPQVSAPPFAVTKGAKGTVDGWWCQLPHATRIPVGLAARRREVFPLRETTYAIYFTWYALANGGGTVTGSPSTTSPAVEVSVYAYAKVEAPTHLVHNPLPKGTKVPLGHGVAGVEYRSGNYVKVTWRFPTKGVPAYLTSVATVTVTGIDLPPATVEAVAKAVRPL